MTTIYLSPKRFNHRVSQHHFIYLFRYLFFLFFLGIQPLFAQTYLSGFSQVQVAAGISNPTVMAFAPDGRIFVAEQTGRLRVIKNGALLSTPFVQLSVNSSGERGLLGIALDPNFSTNNYIYLYYTVPTAPIHNRISRFTANGDVAVAGSETIVLELDNLSGADNHNGGSMKFGSDGKLYVAVGENANPDYAQNLDTYHGKLLRINPDGSVPSGNPYTSGSPQRQRVWSYGLRNPYTLDIQPGTGRIFVNDVGQSTWEEINDATAGGLNFGWPSAEGNSTNPAFANPVYAYGHGSSDGLGCAITGGTFFNPATSNYPASYTGKYFFLDYCSNWINSIDFSGSTAVRSSFATNINGSAVSMAVGNDGNLYYLSRNSNALYKIIYTSNDAPAITGQPASVTITQGQSASFSVTASGTQPLSYQWQKNGVNIAGATSATLSIANVQPGDAGQYRAIVSNSAGSATSNAATLTVSAFNTAPTASITSPTDETIYQAGTVISFSGTGSDPEDGTLPASAYAWSVIFHHDAHTHPGPGVTVAADGKSGTFTIPAEGHLESNVWYRLQLTVTDSQGLSTTTSVDLRPQVVILSFNSNPAGLTINVAGQPHTTPYTLETVAGVVISLSTPSPQTLNGTSYTFSNWENGLGTGGTITVPTTNTTYTANFTINSSLRDPDAVINPTAGLNYAYYEGTWSVLPDFSTLTAIKTGRINTFEISARNRDDFFGFEFNGYVNVPTDGEYTFYTSSDDGSKLWIGSTLVVNNDGLHATEERSGTIGLKAGYHAIRTSFFEHGGDNTLEVSYAGPGLSKQLIPSTALFTGSSLRNPDNLTNPTAGLNYAYYEGTWNALPDFSTLTAIKTGRTSSFNISDRNRDDTFGFEFNGYVNVPTDGEYTFYTSSDDGSQLWIGSTLVVNNDGLHSLLERSGTIGLKAGYHAIRTTYFERWGSQTLEVRYAGPGLTKQLVPSTALFTNSAAGRIASENIDAQANSEAKVLVFPNPAKDYITIRVYAEHEGKVVVNISDVMSRNLSNTSHAVKVGSNDLSQFVGDLPEGLHSVIINNGKDRIVRKLLIKK